MKYFILITLFITTLLGAKMNSIYDFELKDIDGKSVKLEKYKNKVLLIVNVASKCGFTPQYEGLERLYKDYKDKGLVVLGFPCNQFMNQEPASNKEIKEFCSLTYDVSFPMFSKVDVNGENEEALYTFLKKEASGILGTEAIKWNFTKFLVNKKGVVVDRFSPSTTPKAIEEDIKDLL